MGGNDENILNGPILCRSSIIDVVTSSAAESEFAAAFMNSKEAAYIRNILQAMGYQQKTTPIITDNSFVYSIVTGSCKAKRSKSMDMRVKRSRKAKTVSSTMVQRASKYI